MTRARYALALLLPALALPLLPAQPPGGQKYAVLVGINHYQHDRLRDLQYAEADATELADVLKAAGYRVTLLTGSAKDADKQPTKANVEKHLHDALRRCQKGDTALVAFAGHGLQFDGQADAFFCPLDARPFKDETDSLVSLGKVYQELDKSFAGMKVLLVDACRDDPDAGRGSRGGVNADTAPRPPQGVAALFSCCAGERAFEHDRLKHGVFFHHVLQGLKGQAKDADGEVTFAGLAAYVSRRVSRDVPTLIGGGAKQSPNLKADYSTEPVLLAVKDSRPVPGNDAGRVQPKPAGGKTETLDLGGGVTMEFVRIPAGSFTMGSPQAELDEYKRLYNLTNLGEEQHPVRIGKDFYLGKYPVTQEQYQAVTGTNPSWFSVSGGGKDKVARLDTRRFPVEQVSWEDAVAFCEKLSRPGKRVTLPTEAEWEYACRGGTKTAFYFGAVLNGTQANCDGKVNSLFGTAAKGSSLGRTSRIGSYEKVAPHPWGLCDMHGNVWQWCQDWWDGDYYKRSPNLDPLCRDGEQKYRVLRGGSWFSDGLDCRSGSRSWLGPSVRRDDYGFRVALRLD